MRAAALRLWQINGAICRRYGSNFHSGCPRARARSVLLVQATTSDKASAKPLRKLARLAKAADTADSASSSVESATALNASSLTSQSKPSLGSSASSAATAKAKATDASATQEKSAKDAALDNTLQRLNKKYGSGTIGMFGDRKAVDMERLSTGAMMLDSVLGGGVPRGRIVEIYGPESSGKTSLALCIMAEAQRRGENVAMVDAEHAFDALYASKLGLDPNKLVLSTPSCGDDALDIVDELCRSGAMAVVLVDSVAALVPKTEMERDMGDPQMGSAARLMSGCLKRITPSAAAHGTTVIFINQLRMKIGVVYGNPETTTGGMALRYYSSQRIEVRKNKIIEGEKEGPAKGLRVKAKVAKNKSGAPGGIVYFDILFGSGVDKTGCMLDAAVSLDVVLRRGAFHYFEFNGEEVKLGQGRDRSIAFLDDPGNAQVREAVESETRTAMADGKMVQVVPEDDDFM